MLIVRKPDTDQEWTAYYALRFKVLREPWDQPRGSERLEDDSDATHVAAFNVNNVQDKQVLVGCARLHRNSDYYGSSRTVGQVRLVAVEPGQGGRGIGKALMKHLEAEAANDSLDEIIVEARENAVEFYKALGYEIVEESYLLYGKIQHWIMKRKLSQLKN